ncbi:MAG: tRNA (N(6)-L-threonylcarbamoyladenosine(37)-C(2))-methylthiotransferase MtaB [Firmicutes bacterium]|nr:tRNA (N(6)-L-threonylcarbamoyladenosine(37)-C(2))-methylthiotransferase MtaB [Bacillota bacterium]
MATAAFYTLGCKVNQTDTAALQNLLAQAGYHTVTFDEVADVYVINTCTVTHLGDRKSRQMIRRARRKNPDAVIVVTGCYAQVAADDIMNISDVDLAIGTHSREQLPELIMQAKQGRINCVAPMEQKHSFDGLGVAQSGERTRAFLKVQEGCRQFCSYCIVPYARGPVYSRPLAESFHEAQKLVAQGFRELVVTGIHLGYYGVDLAGDFALSDLLRRLASVNGLARIRISSLEPTEVTADLLDVMQDYSNVCHHLHIPLQSGDDDVLRRMNRKYDASEFLRLVDWIRAQIPDIALTTDVMVGFPGETEEQFQHTCEVVHRAAFSRLHVFKYSPRQGTPAANYDQQVPPPIKDKRSHTLTELGEELAVQYRKRFIGTTMNVLFEEDPTSNQRAGLTEHYLRVTVMSSKDLVGAILPVKITSVVADGLTGRLL